MKISHVFFIAFSVVFCGCSSSLRFYVCPNEVATVVKSKTDIGEKKEVLVDLDYRVLAVHKNKNKEVVPIQHYRPEHTFGNRTHPRSVSFDKPLTLTALVIIKELTKPIGIAIRKRTDIEWRVYWMKDSDIGEIRKNSVVYLPPYKKLPLMKKVNS